MGSVASQHTTQPKPYSTLGRAIRVAALAALLRAGVVGLHQLEQIDYRRYTNLNFFALPVLELLVLLLVIVPSFWMLKRETQIRSLGIAMLMAVIINALLQIVDKIRAEEVCDGLDFYTFEKYCELIIMQSLCNIPFVLIGLVVLLIWWPRAGSYSTITIRRDTMGKWRVLSAVVAGFAGFFFGPSPIYGSFNTNLTSTVFIPLGALVALGLGIVTWKYKKEDFSYFTLLATAGIGGAVLGLMLIAFVLD